MAEKEIIELAFTNLAAIPTLANRPFMHPYECRQPISKDHLASVCSCRSSSAAHLAVLGLHDAAQARSFVEAKSSTRSACACKGGSQLSWSDMHGSTKVSQPLYEIRPAGMRRIYGET